MEGEYFSVKPRRTKGTALYRLRNYYAAAFVAFSASTGLLFHFLAKDKYNERYKQGYYDEDEDTKNRKMLMSSFTITLARPQTINESIEAVHERGGDPGDLDL